MAEVVVQIELDTEAGTVMVGMVPSEGEQAAPADKGAAAGLQPDQGQQGAPGAPRTEGGGEEEAEKAYMKPVKSVEEALQVARDMLTGQSGAQAQAAQAEGDFSKGFSQGAGAPAGRPTRMPGA